MMKSTREEIIQFLQQEFPQSLEKCQIEAVVPQGATVLYRVSEQELRPGGTVSGPP
jgi:hypothetical protein